MSKKAETNYNIENFDRIFTDKSGHRRTGLSVLMSGLGFFKGKIFVSQIAFIIKHSPTWVLPIVTAEITNIAASPLTDDTYRQILIYSLILVFILIQNVPTHMWYAHLTNTVLRRFSASVRNALVTKLQHLSLTYHKQIETGRLQSKFLRDIESVTALANTMLLTVLPAVISVVVAIGISLYRSPGMTLFFLVVVPLNIVVTQMFRRPIGRKYRELRVASEEVSTSFTTMLKMIPVTKAHGLEEQEKKNVGAKVNELTRVGLSTDATAAGFGSTCWVISNLLTSSCLILCAILAVQGKIEIGDIVLYQSLFSQINGNVSTLVNVFPTLASGLDAMTSISDVMSSEDEERNGDVVLENVDGNIDFNGVSYAYPDAPEHAVLDSIDLHVKKGECIAFVGSSGSGKTTVINMIIGFLRPTVGTMEIDGVNVNELSVHDFRHHISVVPQNSILFPGTVRENIVYGMESYSELDFQRVLEMANINEFLPQLPYGLETEVGEGGDKLSGGQRQRITIALALLRNPSILILDEATSALDNVSEYHVQKAIEQVVKGRTTFIVAHRLSTIRNADRIVVMDAGKIVECGTYDELMAQNGRFFELKSLSDIAVKATEGEGYITYK